MASPFSLGSSHIAHCGFQYAAGASLRVVAFISRIQNPVDWHDSSVITSSGLIPFTSIGTPQVIDCPLTLPMTYYPGTLYGCFDVYQADGSILYSYVELASLVYFYLPPVSLNYNSYSGREDINTIQLNLTYYNNGVAGYRIFSFYATVNGIRYLQQANRLFSFGGNSTGTISFVISPVPTSWKKTNVLLEITAENGGDIYAGTFYY